LKLATVRCRVLERKLGFLLRVIRVVSSLILGISGHAINNPILSGLRLRFPSASDDDVPATREKKEKKSL
jgi:hypothetical protein